jgi:hypothetical protein
MARSRGTAERADERLGRRPAKLAERIERALFRFMPRRLASGLEFAISG